MQIKITHLTSSHPRYDTRIFLKECSSLAKNEDYVVSLIVADNKGNELKNRIYIYDVGKLSGRLNRIIKTTKLVLYKAIELDSDIYHFHDPELIPVGIKLKKLGKKVIFDIHENIPLQIKDKAYLPFLSRNILSFLYSKYEKITLKKFNTLILAENSYLEYYSKISATCSIILNLPDINLIKQFQVTNRNSKKNELFYIGGVSNERGLDVTLAAIKTLRNDIPDLYMHYIGATSDNILDDIDVKSVQNNINFYGALPLYEGLKISTNTQIGLSILKPIANYKRSYSTKIFEYMAIGLPVITSNFELYKNIVEKYQCGLCINPLDSNELADAIRYILSNPIKAQEMGENGKKIVEEKYNWAIEEQKLYTLYKELLT